MRTERREQVDGVNVFMYAVDLRHEALHRGLRRDLYRVLNIIALLIVIARCGVGDYGVYKLVFPAI